ncbi:MAG: NAD(P)/FAD-dependent oxidoreductase [Solirubrobacterales bacterium]
MKIFIVGGGFAGIQGAKVLAKNVAASNEIFLMDKNKYTTMLPNLPEFSSERLMREDISENIEKLIPSSVKFLNEEITEINLDNKTIITKNTEYTYDYILLAAGSVTNFFGFDKHMDKVNTLESIIAAESVHDKFIEYIDKTDSPTLVVSGAGFTGIELACNLYDLAKKKGKLLNVVFVELAKTFLPMLSEKSHLHVEAKLKELKFKVYTDNKIVDFDGSNITLKDNEVLENVFFCWCSGVKSPIKPIGTYEALPDGRIIVNENLSVPGYPEVFAAGDAAAMKDKDGKYLRRAVNFAQMSGKHAGKNMVSAINNEEQEPFNPIDLGWIIPLYISSIGVVLGKEVSGRKGIFIHYMICGVKNYNIRNFFKEFRAAIKYPFVKL